MDQGNVAVRSREVWYEHRFTLTGEDTSIKGVYHGPGYIWYVSIAYFLTGGHPVSPVIMQIFLNLFISIFLLWQIAKNDSIWRAIIIVLSLQVFWPFFDTSRFSFNPFPSVAISIATVLLLTSVLNGRVKNLIFASAISGLIIHTEIASYPPIFLLWFSVGLLQLSKKKILISTFLHACAFHLIFFLPHFLSESTSGFSQFRAFWNQFFTPGSNMNKQNWEFMMKVFGEHLSESLIPNNWVISTILLILALILVLIPRRQKIPKFTSLVVNQLQISKFSKRFFILTISLFIASYVYFASNQGWNSWHTNYISPLIFIAVMLIILSLKKLASFVIFTIIFVFQFNVFVNLYTHFSQLSDDASILRNELTAIDWVYQRANGNGFYVYSYLPSVYDYPYQYLFWWYGRKNYHYLPCEYTTFPNVPDLFVPNYKDYQEPKRMCQNIRFLIIEPNKNEFLRQKWIDQLTKNTTLVEETKVGKITVQKRTF